jgi:hypothetical protein
MLFMLGKENGQTLKDRVVRESGIILPKKEDNWEFLQFSLLCFIYTPLLRF